MLREARFSHSLERGLAILGCFSPAEPVLGISDIADELGMSRSTTHRYVITLVALRYLEQGADRKYRLALRVTDLGLSSLASTNLHHHGHEFLEGLRRRSSYTASLTVLDGLDILYIDRVASLRRGQAKIELGTRPGSRQPVYCTAAGKLLLAALPESELKNVMRELRLAARAPNTTTSKPVLQAELELLRQDSGVATADEELHEGLVAIAAPVRDSTRETVAALSLAAHTSMISLEDMVEHLSAELVATADRLSARLGYRRRDESEAPPW